MVRSQLRDQKSTSVKSNSTVSSASRQPLGAESQKSEQPTSVQVPFTKVQSLPIWLRVLMVVNHGSSLVLLVVAGGLLSLYGWSVYTQKAWSQEYEQLKALQRQERQLITATEMLKNQIAELSQQPDTGLVPPSPAKTVFLQPLPPRPLKAPTAKTSTSKTPPLAY
jgi:hypothetical protein